MRRINQDWSGNPLLITLRNAWRRVEWFTQGVSTKQLANGAFAAANFGIGRQRVRSWPVLVKIDISPACNLHCTYCVHANPVADLTGTLVEQRFTNEQRMSLHNYGALIDQIAQHSAAVALYYVGDPLMHPELSRFCRIAADAGLNCHVSTNFSFRLSDDRLMEMITSGLTHLTVCVDSMQQARYELTRIGGRIDWVLSNLARLLDLRSQYKTAKPKVEVQFIKYQHNVDEVEEAARWCQQHGVDQFTEYWGNLYNYADIAPSNFSTGEPLDGLLIPRCAWPWFAMQIKYNGDVLPCCYHRVSEQYRPNGDSRPVGNAFLHGVHGVWTSPAYQQLRRLSANPRKEPATGTFCEGCHLLCQTPASNNVITAASTRWEDVYLRSATGEIIRRR